MTRVLSILLVGNRDDDKEKYVYIGYGIPFDGKSSWCFNNDLDRNVIIVWVDNGSSLHTDNLKNNFLILGEGDTFDVKEISSAREKKY